MAIVQCKGCHDKTSEHDTLEGYCMLCAAQKIRWYAKLQAENKRLKDKIDLVRKVQRICKSRGEFVTEENLDQALKDKP